jgi:hypothetical protein
MDNFNWALVFEGISTLSRALPKDERLRKWVIIGTAVVVVVAAIISTQGKEGSS